MQRKNWAERLLIAAIMLAVLLIVTLVAILWLQLPINILKL